MNVTLHCPPPIQPPPIPQPKTVTLELTLQEANHLLSILNVSDRTVGVAVYSPSNIGPNTPEGERITGVPLFKELRRIGAPFKV